MVSPVLVLAGALFLTILVANYIQNIIHHRRNAKRLNCAPITQGPTDIFGIRPFYRLAQAVREKRWVEYIAGQYANNGYTFGQNVLGRKIVSTIEPENIKAVLATQFNDFCLGTRHREFYPLLGDGIFTLDGAGWTHSRGMLRPQFARDQVADLDLMDGHITRLIELIPRDGSSFDIQPLFFLLTIDSATHFLFGESVGSMGSSGETTNNSLLGKSSVGNANGFAQAFNTAQEWLASRSRAANFYWMINPQEFRDSSKRVHEVVDHYVQLALESKKRNPEKKPGERYIFAEALAAESDNPKLLRDQMLNILLAGRDTTASLLSSCFFYLSRNQAVWKRLRQAIVDEFGDVTTPGGEITHAKLKNIPYLRYVLNESTSSITLLYETGYTDKIALRLMPPVPLNFRVAVKDTSLPTGGGPNGRSPVYVRKGQVVTYSVFAMHRRKDIWGSDAEEFRPERWEENGRRGWEYLPFNGGPRICLGQQYALTEASFTLVRLLQRFDEVVNTDELVRPAIQSSLTMSHDRGVYVRVRGVDA